MAKATAEYEDLTPVLLGDREIEYQDPDAINRAITEHILGATTIDEILAPVGTTSAEDVAGMKLSIRGVRFNRSSFEDGPGVYCLIDATATDSGEAYTIACGARNVMAKLYRAHQLGVEIPPVMIVKSKTATSNGYFPLDLVAA